jgi:hypothetical protein
VAARLPVDSLPDVAFDPVHAPLAVQLVASVEDQVSIDEPPVAILVGFADMVTVGATGAVTATVVDWLPSPPVPVHDSV